MKKIIFLFLIVLIGCKQPVKGDYQLYITNDVIYIYDGDRHVATMSSSDVPKLDSIIIQDNQ